MAAGIPPVMVLCDRYPELSETFIVNEIRGLERAGAAVAVEAVAAPSEPARGVAPPRAVWEHEATRERLAALAWLIARHPMRCAGDLRARRRWRRHEPVPPLRMLAPAARRIALAGPVHLHVHFAAGAALSALRIARLVGARYSVTAHAYDIYQRPANLREKLARSSFATTGCEYTLRDVRAAAGAEHAGRMHRIVMGVDPAAFSRSRPLPGGRHILAVGRLVEKKGFADLIEAVALMRLAGAPPERVTIVGDGPLRDRLTALVARHDLGALVDLAGAQPHAAVREHLEAADVLCMPCVVASDGDRDSSPVVVKEALAMQVPVVATDEVGLPEVVRPEWGALVPPNDPRSLADALARELARPLPERAARGAAGRAFVVAECDFAEQARRLAAFIRAAGR